MRSLERPAQGLTAALIALFAIPPAALLIAMASKGSFWISMLPLVAFLVILEVMREPLRTLGRAPRFVGWFCIGVTATTFFALVRGVDLTLTFTAGTGLGLAIIDLIGALWSERKAANERAGHRKQHR